MYCVISKIDWDSDKEQMRYTPMGYTQNEDDCMVINDEYDNTLGAWIKENELDLSAGYMSLSTFFSETPHVYIARTGTLEKGNLEEINDISDL